jgi:hypothetical protein
MASKRSFLLRIPPALWGDIKRWADDDLRSVNAQIEWILREAVAKRRGRPPAEPEDEPDTPAGDANPPDDS